MKDLGVKNEGEDHGVTLPTLARGARQLVVQLALETISMFGWYVFSLTPTTNMGASAEGAEIITFFAPPCKTNEISSKNMSFFKQGLCELNVIKSYEVNVCLYEKCTFKWDAAFEKVVNTPEDSTT